MAGIAERFAASVPVTAFFAGMLEHEETTLLGAWAASFAEAGRPWIASAAAYTAAAVDRRSYRTYLSEMGINYNRN